MAYKIQYLGLGGILDQAIAITKNHFGLLFTIMLLVLIPFNLITGFISLSVLPDLAGEPTMETYMELRKDAKKNFCPPDSSRP